MSNSSDNTLVDHDLADELIEVVAGARSAVWEGRATSRKVTVGGASLLIELTVPNLNTIEGSNSTVSAHGDGVGATSIVFSEEGLRLGISIETGVKSTSTNGNGKNNFSVEGVTSIGCADSEGAEHAARKLGSGRVSCSDIVSVENTLIVPPIGAGPPCDTVLVPAISFISLYESLLSDNLAVIDADVSVSLG